MKFNLIIVLLMLFFSCQEKKKENTKSSFKTEKIAEIKELENVEIKKVELEKQEIDYEHKINSRINLNITSFTLNVFSG